LKHQILKGSGIVLFFLLAVACSEAGAEPTQIAETAATEPAGAAPTPAPTPRQERPKKIHFVGNSVIYYNGGVENHLRELASSANSPIVIEADSSTRGGVPLEGLWKFTLATERIENGDYDVVVLQEDIQLSTSYKESKSVDSFHEYARKYDTKIKESGAKTVLYMAWPVDDGLVNPITYEELVQAHREVAAEIGADVAPVALAMQRSMAERPELDVIGRDNTHPSIYGTYLAANVIYATIFGESPEGLTYLPQVKTYFLSNGRSTKGINEEDAAFLQRIAWETVQDFQAQS
jgi:hypothetical protein